MKLALNLPPLVVLVCLALLAPLGVAHADTALRRDARGDVVVVSDNGPNRTAPRNRYADITRFRVTHDRTRVRLSMRVRKLQRRDFNFGVSIRTPRTRFGFNIAKYEGIDQALFLNADGDPISCRGEQHKVSYRHNLISLSLPRTCLGRPMWVRAGGAFGVVGKSGQLDRLDLSHRRGVASKVGSIPVGGRVRR